MQHIRKQITTLRITRWADIFVVIITSHIGYRICYVKFELNQTVKITVTRIRNFTRVMTIIMIQLITDFND